MQNPPLSACISTLRDQFDVYRSNGMQLHPVAVQEIVRLMDMMVDQARKIERDHAEMEAIARDLDAVSRARAQTLAVPVAGSNVVILFRPSDPCRSGGGDAA